MNVRDVRFDKDILEKMGIGEVYDMLPPIRYSYDLCGTISKEASELTGLPEGTAVAGGMFDIDACAVALHHRTECVRSQVHGVLMNILQKSRLWMERSP